MTTADIFLKPFLVFNQFIVINSVYIYIFKELLSLNTKPHSQKLLFFLLNEVQSQENLTSVLQNASRPLISLDPLGKFGEGWLS